MDYLLSKVLVQMNLVVPGRVSHNAGIEAEKVHPHLVVPAYFVQVAINQFTNVLIQKFAHEIDIVGEFGHSAALFSCRPTSCASTMILTVLGLQFVHRRIVVVARNDYGPALPILT